MEPQISERNVRGKIERDFSLKKLNTWHIGGNAELVFWPVSCEDLLKGRSWCQKNKVKMLLLGRGSNILLPDEGIKGMVIVTSMLKNITWQEKRIMVEAGYPLSQLARQAADKGLEGLEFACGIPGTVGGAVMVNAGAHGAEISDLVRQVRVLDQKGEIMTLDREQIEFSYRTSSLQGKYWILECVLELVPGEPAVLKEKIRVFTEQRKNAQPLEYPNAGSVFRNPPHLSAGALIEQAGWKGKTVGGAQVSAKHANFIINTGKATALDVKTLINAITEDIEDKFGIQLKTEVQIFS
ncbi:UDP-N-acetylmuramate dehydrogenase [Syntrophobotulus glycolicus DSM 8271]|uniref:UDP-N-acetylenolpyruvoylglucosamine reductase n=1 Tax=Syntrophobotulus glycolicus (strain DSM 8271 / FlGlyR) TaxID=645991 RepID=F0T000_SYNGF|nr:UDP-N-acetylmuramate dehydrogenase [Syntrophobotulus glycolicus]ADY55011.1 UDP-N-acetylmuramate dehydrogenase [Syntrophobotulus glycolicus DSM 8271]